ncbi:MAG TPA: hypothetical protein VMI06_11330 [Terriglobia bacterium]|nr:hypothetical protein [Terriglobia bacterium]
MSFSPNIVVTSENNPRILLIVEARLTARGRPEDESQLKSYMLHMRCPIGLLVTPEEVVVYRDTYTARSEESVRRVGAFPAPKEWAAFKAPHHGATENLGTRFEEKVKSWLEHVRSSPSDYQAVFPEDAREILVDYVVPALSEGIVRAGGPRETGIESR